MRSRGSAVLSTVLINIDVDDLERAIDFYTRALELRPARRFGSTGVELLGGPAPIYLLEKAPGSEAAAGLAQRREYGRHWTPVHLDFVVSDIEVAVLRAQNAGAFARRTGVISPSWRIRSDTVFA